MSFFYFFPRLGGLGMFKDAGLSDRFLSDPAQTEVGPDMGPEGATGKVFHQYAGGALPKPVKWERSISGDWWLGWHEPYPPTPKALRRKNSASGYKVEMGDGNNWTIPLVLPSEGREQGLPTGFRLDTDNVVKRLPLAEYAGLIDKARGWLSWFDGAAAFPGDDGLFSFCVDLLAVCYRVGPEEVLSLELLNNDAATECVRASIDMGERINQFVQSCSGGE